MVNIIKNKEEVKSVMNIIQAFADGKTIQAIDPYEDEWVNQAGLNFEALFDGQYRIKPEPKYRPFANAEECWTEMLKHQPFGWVMNENGDYSCLLSINKYFEDKDFSYMFKTYRFVDATPFGIKEVEL